MFLYRFGHYEADIDLKELRKFGVPLPLETKPWLLLIALLQRKGEVITRTELQQSLWGNTVFVDCENGLNVAIRKLRFALCDNVDSPQFIETLPGKGYRFREKVELVTSNGHSPAQEAHSKFACPQHALMLRRSIASLLGVACMTFLCLLGIRLARRLQGIPRVSATGAQIRRYVYVPDYSANAVLGYSVNPATGVLEPVSTGPFNSGEHPYSAAFTPDREFVYVANRGRADGVCGNGCNISGYAVDHVSGGLVELEGSPFPAGSGPVAISVHPSARFVYVANVISNDVQAYTRNSEGRLKPIGQSVPVGKRPFYVAINASGRFLYVTNQDDATVSAFLINSNGELRPIAGSPFATGLRPRSFTIHPSGRFAYVVNYGVDPYIAHDAACRGQYGNVRGQGCTISAFSIDQQTGVLSEVKGSPFESHGTNPIASATDSEGKFLFVTNISSNDLSVFQVNGTSGVIEPVRGSPFPAPFGPCALALDWSDQYLYVVSAYSQSVSQFVVDTDTGRITSVGPALLAGKGPVGIIAQQIVHR